MILLGMMWSPNKWENSLSPMRKPTTENKREEELYSTSIWKGLPLKVMNSLFGLFITFIAIRSIISLQMSIKNIHGAPFRYFKPRNLQKCKEAEYSIFFQGKRTLWNFMKEKRGMSVKPQVVNLLPDWFRCETWWRERQTYHVSGYVSSPLLNMVCLFKSNFKIYHLVVFEIERSAFVDRDTMFRSSLIQTWYVYSTVELKSIFQQVVVDNIVRK